MLRGLSNIAPGVDNAFIFILIVSVALLALVTGVMVYFVIRYRRKANPDSTEVEGNAALEIAWTVIPTIIVLIMFYYGYKGFALMRDVPDGAMPVKVDSKMWSWGFEYENGIKSADLVIPLNKPVKLSLNSEDVIHSLFIPAFRVKEDAVPGAETVMWFTPTQTGTFDLFCTEYCGAGHSKMLAKVIVMETGEFDKWYVETAAKAKPKADGRALLDEKGCLICHSIDGSVVVGPTLKGIFGRSSVVITKGAERTVVADEEYIRKSLLAPNEDVVKGFPDIMPPQGEAMTNDEIEAVVEYLKGLK